MEARKLHQADRAGVEAVRQQVPDTLREAEQQDKATLAAMARRPMLESMLPAAAVVARGEGVR